MPHKPKGIELGSPADWLKRAKSNLAIALQKKSDAILMREDSGVILLSCNTAYCFDVN